MQGKRSCRKQAGRSPGCGRPYSGSIVILCNADLKQDLYMYKEDGLPRRPCGPPRNDRYRRGVIPSGDSADLSDRQNQFRRRRNRESTGFPPWSEESVPLMFSYLSENKYNVCVAVPSTAPCPPISSLWLRRRRRYKCRRSLFNAAATINQSRTTNNQILSIPSQRERRASRT